MTQHEGWDGILEKGEKILWQGRPDERFRIRIRDVATFLSGLAFSGFAVFWMVMAASAGGFFWMFGLIHFAVGLSLSLAPIVMDNIRRKHTWYTLTNRRAFIATDMPIIGRHLKSYPINSSTLIDYEDGTPPSIYFAEEFRRSRNNTRRIRIGFVMIDDARKVLALMKQARREQVRKEQA